MHTHCMLVAITTGLKRLTSADAPGVNAIVHTPGLEPWLPSSTSPASLTSGMVAG
jgi:hypothetical protein